MIFLKAVSSPGSPPRVREKLFGNHVYTSDYGITPACAGKTLIRILKSTQMRDHPRVCGKNHKNQMEHTQLTGSPPRVREKLVFVDSVKFRLGITPACAGKTDMEIEKVTHVRDHPRVCGKNSFWACWYSCTSGSPPRVREKHR